MYLFAGLSEVVICKYEDSALVGVTHHAVLLNYYLKAVKLRCESAIDVTPDAIP